MKKVFACGSMILLLLAVVVVAEYIYDFNMRSAEVGGKQGAEVKNWIVPDKEYLDYYGIGEFKTNLPVLHINTNGQRIEKDTKIWSSMAVMQKDQNGADRSVMETPDYEISMMINYRGASSYSQFDKKQYRLKFYSKEGSTNAKNYDFLGMGKNSEWVLNGPFLDKTLIRNKLVYGLGRELFEWAPDSRYVELFINGEYQGVYLALEPVTNGESRLRLSEFGLASGETAYIVKRDRVGTEEEPLYVYGYYGGKTYNHLYVDYPTKSKLTSRQREWITADIDTFEKVLYGDNFADEKTGYSKYIDVDNFVDYYVLNEVVMNNDAGNLSTYVYKELGGRIKLAIWDYNNCFDNYQWFAQNYDEFFLKDNSWFAMLLKDQRFVDKVIARYKELRKGILSDEYFNRQIDLYKAELGEAVERNFAVWGYTFYDNLLSSENELHKNAKSYDEAIMQLKNSFKARVEFLDNNIGDLYEGCIN
ncbi:MAG: CotH kinase family protein [Lachnospira sp.]|nr:CotH kinase family protein [Lachnospira sp.]